MIQRHLFRSLIAAAITFLFASTLSAQDGADGKFGPATEAAVLTRATDSTVTQKWTSDYGYSVTLPVTAKYNKIGSTYTKEGRTEKVNFILPGGSGAITITYFTEPRMVPKDYRTLDSAHFYQYDSVGRNGIIHRRVYVLRENAIHIDVLLTDKGERVYGAAVPAIFDSFVAPPGTVFALEGWRYGRKESEYESGRYGSGTGPGHDGK